MSGTNWRKEVEAKAYVAIPADKAYLEAPAYGAYVVRAEDALALLERCRVETLEEAAKVLAILDVDANFRAWLQDQIRALKTQRKEGRAP